MRRTRAEFEAQDIENDEDFYANWQQQVDAMSLAQRLALRQGIERQIRECGPNGLIEDPEEQQDLIQRGLLPYIDPTMLTHGIVPSDVFKMRGQCASRRLLMHYINVNSERSIPPRLPSGHAITREDVIALGADPAEYVFARAERAPSGVLPLAELMGMRFEDQPEEEEDVPQAPPAAVAAAAEQVQEAIPPAPRRSRRVRRSMQAQEDAAAAEEADEALAEGGVLPEVLVLRQNLARRRVRGRVRHREPTDSDIEELEEDFETNEELITESLANPTRTMDEFITGLESSDTANIGGEWEARERFEAYDEEAYNPGVHNLLPRLLSRYRAATDANSPQFIAHPSNTRATWRRTLEDKIRHLLYELGTDDEGSPRVVPYVDGNVAVRDAILANEPTIVQVLLDWRRTRLPMNDATQAWHRVFDHDGSLMHAAQSLADDTSRQNMIAVIEHFAPSLAELTIAKRVDHRQQIAPLMASMTERLLAARTLQHFLNILRTDVAVTSPFATGGTFITCRYDAEYHNLLTLMIRGGSPVELIEALLNDYKRVHADLSEPEENFTTASNPYQNTSRYVTYAYDISLEGWEAVRSAIIRSVSNMEVLQLLTRWPSRERRYQWARVPHEQALVHAIGARQLVRQAHERGREARALIAIFLRLNVVEPLGEMPLSPSYTPQSPSYSPTSPPYQPAMPPPLASLPVPSTSFLNIVDRAELNRTRRRIAELEESEDPANIAEVNSLLWRQLQLTRSTPSRDRSPEGEEDEIGSIERRIVAIRRSDDPSDALEIRGLLFRQAQLGAGGPHASTASPLNLRDAIQLSLIRNRIIHLQTLEEPYHNAEIANLMWREQQLMGRAPADLQRPFSIVEPEELERIRQRVREFQAQNDPEDNFQVARILFREAELAEQE